MSAESSGTDLQDRLAALEKSVSSLRTGLLLISAVLLCAMAATFAMMNRGPAQWHADTIAARRFVIESEGQVRGELSEGPVGAQLLLGPDHFDKSGVSIYEGRGRGAQMAIRSGDSMEAHLDGGMIAFGPRRGNVGWFTTVVGGGRQGSLVVLSDGRDSHFLDLVNQVIHVDSARIREMLKER